MIKSFGDNQTEALAFGNQTRLPQDIVVRAKRALTQIDEARNIFDLRNPPSNHLKKLEGPRPTPWSIRINDQWRVVFYWDDVEGDAYRVQITDYH